MSQVKGKERNDSLDVMFCYSSCVDKTGNETIRIFLLRRLLFFYIAIFHDQQLCRVNVEKISLLRYFSYPQYINVLIAVFSTYTHVPRQASNTDKNL